MKKQVLVAAVAMALVAFLFIAGKTSIGKKNTDTGAKKAKQTFNIQLVIKDLAAKLDPQKIEYLAKLENSVKRGDVKTQQIEAFEQLANFWKDSVSAFEPYAFYISEAAQLDNSEKKLTFAAQLFLGRLRQEHDTEKLGWQTQQAILLFNKALQLNPANADLKIGLGSAYVFGSQSGDAQQTMQGIQQLLSVVREDSNNMKAQFVLGVGSAISEYDKAIERRSDHPEAYAARGWAKAQMHDYPGAKTDCDKSIAINPGYMNSYYYRGWVKAELHDFKGAIKDYAKAIELNSKDEKEYCLDGILKHNLKKYNRALKKYNKTTKINPTNDSAYCKRGILKAYLQYYKLAMEDYDKAILINPKNPNAYYRRGFAKSQMHDYSGAITDYTNAIILDPKNENAYKNRGLMKQNMLDYQGAIEDLSKAIEFNPYHAEYYLQRGNIKIKAGQKESGDSDLKKYKELSWR